MSELMISWPFIEKILISLAIGALMGMEREHTKHQKMVGIRTFALVSLLGALFVVFAEATGSNIQVFLGFGAVTLFAIILYAGNLFKFKAIGLTTSIALLIAYGMGTLVAYGMYSQAIFVTIAVTIVLFAKQRLHSFVSHVSDAELLDFLEFLAVVGVVYPVIPTEPIMLLGVEIDLFAVWLLIVLISLINLVGFLGSRFFSADRNVGLMALLGGLVSSTATALTLPTALKKNARELLPWAYLVMSGSAFVRNFVIIAFFAPVAAKYLIPSVAACATVVIGLGMYRMSNSKNAPKMTVESPFKVPKAIELAIKLFIIMVALEVLQTYVPQLFYLAVILGGMVSSASTAATVAILVANGKISVITGAIAGSIAILSGFAMGNVIAMHVAGGGKAVKKVAPYVIGVSVLYVIILFAFMAVA